MALRWFCGAMTSVCLSGLMEYGLGFKSRSRLWVKIWQELSIET
ncbi:hypothetical protein C1G87_1484 [Dehalococcoides mccartyi]|uniref:Uncharacterized protein n=1 Tax=Dehalococcoides mccartyi TaxID=61435 RepID=A0A328EN27_9CHLR|nr:hypothetical protein C1G87_1484 [Dehalococcoides mccartyi]